MAEKKAVLNVTVSESLAAAVRQEAAAQGVPVSSVVEAALAEQIKWAKIRADGIAAVEEEFNETGWPTEEEMEAARIRVDEQIRLHRETLAEDAREREAGRRAPGAA